MTSLPLYKILKMKYLYILLLSFIILNLSAQLVLEKDINTEPGSSNPRGFAQIGDIVYFIADDGLVEKEIHQIQYQWAIT